MTVTVDRWRSRRSPPVAGFEAARRGWVVTGITGLVLFVFLLPGIHGSHLLKSEQMLSDIEGPILPQSAATFEYEGEQLDIYTVPMPDGTERELAMLQPGRQTSQFIDPADPSAGPIEWEGNWRLLEPPTRSTRNGKNYSQAWDLMDFPLLLRNTLVIAGLGTIGAVGSSILVAYRLTRFHVPFGRSIMVVLIATIILPRYATLVPPTRSSSASDG